MGEKRNTQLDHLQQIDVTPKGLIMVVRFVRKGTDRTSDDSGELRILDCQYHHTQHHSSRSTYHTNVRILLHQMPQHSHLLRQIMLPHIPYPRLNRSPGLILQRQPPIMPLV